MRDKCILCSLSLSLCACVRRYLARVIVVMQTHQVPRSYRAYPLHSGQAGTPCSSPSFAFVRSFEPFFLLLTCVPVCSLLFSVWFVCYFIRCCWVPFILYFFARCFFSLLFHSFESFAPPPANKFVFCVRVMLMFHCSFHDVVQFFFARALLCVIVAPCVCRCLIFFSVFTVSLARFFPAFLLFLSLVFARYSLCMLSCYVCSSVVVIVAARFKVIRLLSISPSPCRFLARSVHTSPIAQI